MMKGLETIFLWIGTHFTPEAYMFYSKLHGLLWSAADVVLILALLKIADWARRRREGKRIRVRYILVLFSALLTPLLLFSRTPKEFFRLECVICGIQFLILIYTVMVERKGVLDVIRQIQRGSRDLA